MKVSLASGRRLVGPSAWDGGLACAGCRDSHDLIHSQNGYDQLRTKIYPMYNI